MKLTDSEGMRTVDKFLSVNGIPEIVPMEHAAKAVADTAVNLVGAKANIIVLCGTGNNGGDGFGAARWLNTYGAKVQCFGMGTTRNEALTEYNLLTDSKVKVTTINTPTDLDYFRLSTTRADLIIDALLGTGFTGELKENYCQVCELINKAACPVLSIDIPSGVDADTGHCAQQAVAADITVTLCRPKVGLFLYPAKNNVGQLVVADIGITGKCLAADPGQYYLADKKMIRDLLPVREADAHKGDNGRVLVVAGSPGYVGAAALCTRAAVKTGAGLVTLLTPEPSARVLAIKLDEEMVRPLPVTEKFGLSSEAAGIVTEFNADVLAIGPGLGRSEETCEQIRKIIATSSLPMIIDADALYALSGHSDVLISSKAPKVLTPHAGEMARLTGHSTNDINSNKLSVAVRYAKRWNVILLLKGAPTVIALPTGQTYIVESGNSAMATGGSGDVLTGILAGFAAQGLELDAATLCGAYLHGLAGTLVTEGIPGLAAGEIISALPRARQLILEDDEPELYPNKAIRPIT